MIVLILNLNFIVMKNSKFLLFAFVLLIVVTPVLFAFAFEVENDLPDKENAKVVLVFGQEKTQSQDLTNVSDFLSPRYYSFAERDEPKIYTDAVDLDSQYHLTNPTKAITVKDLSRNINPFRFNKYNRKFITSNLYINSKGKV